MSSNAFDRARRALDGIPDGFQKAVFSAMGRTVSHGKTSLRREIQKKYTVKTKVIRKTIATKLIKKPDITEGQVQVKSPNLLANQFSLRPQSDTTGAKRKEVRLGIRKGSTKRIERGFVSKGIAFKRKGKDSYPIEPVFGPAVPGLVDERMIDTVLSDAKETFEKRLKHEVSRVLKRIK
ncbi:phage tail protein [Turicimonas sp. TL08]